MPCIRVKSKAYLNSTLLEEFEISELLARILLNISGLFNGKCKVGIASGFNFIRWVDELQSDGTKWLEHTLPRIKYVITKLVNHDHFQWNSQKKKTAKRQAVAQVYRE